MNILHKIQNLSESKRKMILWGIVIIIGLSLLSWWAKNFQQRLRTLKDEGFLEELNFPSFDETLKEMPQLEIPKINGE